MRTAGREEGAGIVVGAIWRSMNFSCAGWVVDVIAQRGWLMLPANGSQVSRWRSFGMCPQKGRSSAEAMRFVHVTGHVVLDRLTDRDCN